jgi:flagellar M-ring protein FliF
VANQPILRELLAQVRRFWSALTPGRRVSLLAVVGVTIAAFIGIALYLVRDDFRPLVSNVSVEETQAIGKLLREQNIPTRLSPGGNGLLIPAERLDEARLAVATAGLAQGAGAGFELFDQSDIGMTSFREQVNYRRALEGELSRTIRSLAVVRSARVHIVLPKNTIFKEDRKPASASVVVNLQAGKTLDAQQVKGIRYLVGSAVEGLDPDLVTILDGRGAVLARMGDGSDGSKGGERLDYQRELERRLEDRIHGLLEPLVGAGKVVAQVNVEVDYKHVEEMNEMYSPERSVIRSEQRSSERRTGGESAASGVAGAQSNLPGGPSPALGQSGSRFEKNSEVVNYEVDKRILKTEHATNTLKRLSVAVVVDGSQLPGDGEAQQPAYKPRSQDELARFDSLVKKAVGFDAKRGDQVEVTNLAFEAPEAIEESTFAFLESLDLGPILKIAGLLLLLVILLVMVIRPTMRAIAPSPHGIMLKPGQTATVVEMERRLLNQSQNAGRPVGGLLESGQEDPSAVANRLAQQNPNRVVQVVRGWLDTEGA